MEHLLNEEQRKVVENLSENIVLYAGAGTGKTFTVANRIAAILTGGAATAEEILCLTFTIKAANEMREDIARIAGKAAQNVCVQTIHGFCYSLLKEEERLRAGNRCHPQVIDEVDEEGLLQSIYLARASEWKLSDRLKKQGILVEIEALKTQPLYIYQGQLGWLTEKGFLTRDGELHLNPAPAEIQKPTGTCSVCRAPYDAGEEICSACGSALLPLMGLPVMPAPMLFSRKKNPLMGVVTLIKHARAEYGLYGENEAQDYQKAWCLFCARNQENAERALSYFKKSYLSKEGGLELDEPLFKLLLQHAGDLTAEYDRTLAQSNQLDFDDLILRADRYLSEEETAARYARHFRFITVDEMQDTSLTEYRLLKKLFLGNNVMLCGDIFQTIYGWRGSDPQQVLSSFEREFSPTVYAFKENYRSTKTLANAAFGYLQNTYPQFVGGALDRLSVHSEEDGEKILCLGFDSLREEAGQIYSYIQKHRPAKAGDLCVMARSNGYIANLSAAFERFNALQKREEDKVRFFTVEKDQAFFKRACVKDVLAVLRLLVNPSDRVSMERIAGKYVRGVGVKTLETLRDFSEIGLSVTSFLEESAVLGNDPYTALLSGVKQGGIVVYDTETTGLDLSKDEIVQLSAIRLNSDGEIADTLDLFVLPTVPISQAAQETHGFDLEFLLAQGAISAKEALKRFSVFADGAVLVGHNSLRFDAPLLSRQFKEQGLPPLRTLGEYDTLSIAKQFLSGLPDYKLSTLCAHYGITNEAAHNALGDITATAKVLWKLIEEKILPTQAARIEAVQKYASKFEKLYAFYQELREMLLRNRVGELVPRIIGRMQLDKKYSAEGDREALRDVAHSLRVADVNDGQSFLASYLADAALSGSQMDVLMQKLQKIPLITVHQSKGCEFSTVFLAGVSERFFPMSLAKGTPQEEEEKKVFYVAITRAKKRLILTRVTKDYHTGEEIDPSPYVRNIPERYVWKNEEW